MVLRIKKVRKIILLLISIIFLSACEANYTITINKDSINEKIEVLDNVSQNRTVTDIMENYKRKYPVYDYDKIEEYDNLYVKYDGVEYYNQTYSIDDNGYHLFYDYTYPIEKFKEANSINYTYNYKNITYKDNILKIAIGATNNNMKYDNNFTNLTVNIITDYIVLNNNADSVIGNRYIWYINKNNNDEKLINFEVDLSKTQSEIDKEEKIKEKKNNLLIPVLVGALIIYSIIIFIIITKRRKNEG